MPTRKTSHAVTPSAPSAPSSPPAPPAPTPPMHAAFGVVAIGASAGGLAAFESFFSGLPADQDFGMAFVLVQHLAPDHKSLLAELVRRYTRMEVFEVEDGMPVKVNCVYVIPPNYDLALINGILQLSEPTAPRGQRLPIDFFFSSLAQDLHERAIGVILSGTGSDGAMGVRAIKAGGGLVLAQKPETTQFDGMPYSAMATGAVDYTLDPSDMPRQILSYASHAFLAFPQLGARLTATEEDALKKVFTLLRAHTGHDFSGYKRGTIMRRLERRMAVNQALKLDEYTKLLQQNPVELDALFHDLLIGVTNFFRDPEAFAVLEDQAIPKIYTDKAAGATVRVWVAGCSTGEEAYSIAILLQERMEALKTSFTIQVFATDIDHRAIATARAGLYPASISKDVSPERLARFFVLEPGGQIYRVHKSILDMLIFSEQNVINDPPFSRLDLISCRNLLIYLNHDLQQRLIPLFHYALMPGGLLWLGTSEGVGEYAELFTPLDRKAKLYQRKEDFNGQQRAALSRALRVTPTMTALKSTMTTHPYQDGKISTLTKLPLQQLTEQALLQQFVAVGALINAQGDLLYLHGRSGPYLELASGEAGILNILKMTREGLRPALASALHKCVTTQEVVHTAHLQVKTNGHFSAVNLYVRPVEFKPSNSAAPADAQLYLVSLMDSPEPGIAPLPSAPGTASAPVAESDALAAALAQITALKEDLRAKEEYLQSTREELESSNEELKSSNEEMQSVNEELQSTNEELETSKEELQSVNEELATVNTELHTKVTDLSRLNNDMNNLLAGTCIATVFVDPMLRILRFTPTAAQIINLIPGDVGRPVGHIVSNLVGYNTLVADAKTVLDTLIPKDEQVQTTNGAWFTMRIRPYRTQDNVIEGVVVTFIEVTDIKRVEQELEKANAQLRKVSGEAPAPDLDKKAL